MTTIIENTATLLESVELCFRTSKQDPYFLLDTEQATRAEVARNAATNLSNKRSTTVPT